MKNQPWPSKEELPKYMARLRQGIEGETAHNAFRCVEVVLQDLGLLPREPETPAERAMRTSRERRLTVRQRNELPPRACSGERVGYAEVMSDDRIIRYPVRRLREVVA